MGKLLNDWLEKYLLKGKVPPAKEVPQDNVRRQKRLDAEIQSLQSMRTLAINESDPQFLTYVTKRERELQRLIDAQLEGEYEVMTEDIEEED